MLQLPPLEMMISNTSLPNRFNPSDHYLLCADLSLSVAVEKFNPTNLLETGFKAKPKEDEPTSDQLLNEQEAGVLGKRDELTLEQNMDSASKQIKTDNSHTNGQNLGGYGHIGLD